MSGEGRHPAFCSCAIPCRSCGHESEEHAGSMWYGTGPRRCLATGCKCKGAYIGSTPARCKQECSPTLASGASTPQIPAKDGHDGGTRAVPAPPTSPGGA